MFSKHGNLAWHELLSLLSGYNKWDWGKATDVLGLRGKRLPWRRVTKGVDQYGADFRLCIDSESASIWSVDSSSGVGVCV
ncbi:MAG: hypothetical protein ACKESB_02665 [Candidatus Hodgkinia cicadicola]